MSDSIFIKTAAVTAAVTPLCDTTLELTEVLKDVNAKNEQLNGNWTGQSSETYVYIRGYVDSLIKEEKSKIDSSVMVLNNTVLEREDIDTSETEAINGISKIN